MRRFQALCAAIVGAASLAAQTAVLYTGSDWDDAGAPLRAAWADPAFANAANVALETVDAPERVDEAVKAEWERQKGLRLDVRRIPAFAWFDAKGRCVLLREGLEAADVTSARRALKALIAEGRAREKAVADLLSKGTAEAAGEALALVTPELGARRAREARGLKDAWDLLKAKDPEDATGWAFALTFDPASDACYKVQAFARKGDVAGAEAYIRELEAKPQGRLSVNQRQGLMLLRYVLCRGDPAKAAEMTRLLRETLALGAGTHFGIAAQGLLCLRGEGPVAVPYGWFPGHVPAAGARTWEIAVGVPKTLRGPGRYALTLSREKGSRGPMRVEALEVGGRDFGSADVAPGGTAELPFEWSGEGDPKLTLRVAFDAPGAAERGRLALRPLLPARVIRPGTPHDHAALPGASRRGGPAVFDTAIREAAGETWWASLGLGSEPAVAAYARAAIPEETFRAIFARPGGAVFLAAFFGDVPWMEDFFASGKPLHGWSAALRALDAMAYHCPGVLASPILRRWAAAAALNAGDDPTEAVRLLEAMLALRAEGRLVRGADGLRCDEMRFVLLPAQCDADNARWLAGRHHVPPRQYGGACWAAPYRLRNFFGDSIHGRDYYPPWEHAYLRHEAPRKVGGVCGALSYYGSAAAKAHGVPSTPGGQPGHCAYMVWSATDGRWQLAYNVGPHTGSHFGLWDGRERFAYIDLAADAFARAGMRESMRRLWRIEAERAALPPERRGGFDPGLARRWLAAAEACPVNLFVWRAYADWLKGCDGVPSAAWEAFAKAAARGLNGHLEPAWELLCATALPEIRKAGGQEALSRALVALHGILRQGDWETAEFCDYGRLLSEQAKLLGDDPQACFAFFAADLPTQFGTADAFGRLMRWGGSRFLGDPGLAPRYVAALEGLLKTRGNGDDALGRYIREAIREASRAGNVEAFRSLCALQDTLEPAKGRAPADVAFAGAPLLSDLGLLRLSSSSHWDHPEAYGHVIDGLAPTRICHTSQEKAPWAEIILPGMAELSAVYVGNRPGGNAGRLVPFVVEVSEDGNGWSEVARETRVRDAYRLTFAPVKARRVRVRCCPEGKTFLHLRKFCVFGKRLY